MRDFGGFGGLFVAAGSNYKVGVGLVEILGKCSTRKRSGMRF